MLCKIFYRSKTDRCTTSKSADGLAVVPPFKRIGLEFSAGCNHVVLHRENTICHVHRQSGGGSCGGRGVIDRQSEIGVCGKWHEEWPDDSAVGERVRDVSASGVSAKPGGGENVRRRTVLRRLCRERVRNLLRAVVPLGLHVGIWKTGCHHVVLHSHGACCSTDRGGGDGGILGARR